jgi:Domain of unknown function (DUF929)
MPKANTGPSRQTRPAPKNASKTTNKQATGSSGRTSTKQGGAASATLARRRLSGSPPPPPTTFRSRHPLLAALVPVGLVVAAIATLVVIKVAGGPASASAGSSHLQATGTSSTDDAGTTTLSPAVLAALSVPASTLDAVGSPGSDALPSRTGGNAAIGRASDGKPLITYVGAEYCPYCAAERWAMAVALSRFGTFSGLSGTHSSSSDVYPDTQTLSFYGSSYSSPYVDFQPVEEATNQEVDGSYPTLQTPTAAQSTLLSTYDQQGSIPFVDIADRYLITGASYSPQVLQGLSQSQIAAQLGDPSSPVAQAIDGTANDITAAICSVTGNQPSSVCDSPAIAAIAKTLGAS